MWMTCSHNRSNVASARFLDFRIFIKYVCFICIFTRISRSTLSTNAARCFSNCRNFRYVSLCSHSAFSFVIDPFHTLDRIVRDNRTPNWDKGNDTGPLVTLKCQAADVDRVTNRSLSFPSVCDWTLASYLNKWRNADARRTIDSLTNL